MNKINNIQKARIGAYAFMGATLGKIKHIPDYMYNKLRCYYHNGVPFSFFILFPEIFTIKPFDRCILFTKVLEENDYQIVLADKTVMGQRSFIIANDKVYDIGLGTITDKDYYFKLYKPSDLTIMQKDEIDAIIKEYEIGSSNLKDAENVDIDKLDKLDDMIKNYKGKHKALYDRQVKSYFDDINYEDGLLYIDINKKSM
jgi:hypothetical protein